MQSKSLTDSAGSAVVQKEMLDCYQRAQHLSQGSFSKCVARNTTFFPIWIGKSNCFWYEREFKEGKEFRLVDAENRTNSAAFNHQVLAEALADATGEAVDDKDLPVNNINGMASHNLQITLQPLIIRFSAFDRRWEFNDESGTLIQVEQIPSNWVVSPDGSQVAFSRDYNIWIRDLKTGNEYALTSDGEEFFQYGIPGFVWGNDAFGSVLSLQARWSPDSKYLFTIQLDQRQVKTVDEIQHVPLDGSLRPKTRQRKLAFPEDTHIETYRLLVINIETAHSQDVNYGRIPAALGACGGFFDNSLGWWGSDSRCAYFVDLDRYHRYVRVVALDAQTGATSILFEETSTTRIELLMHPLGLARLLPLPATQELLWISERSGWAHVYLYDLNTGALKNTVTSGEWLVRDEMVHFDAERRELFLSTAGRVSGRNPYYCDLVRVNVDSGELTTLASSDHDYVTQSSIGYAQLFKGYAGLSCGVSSTADYAVVTRSRVDEVTQSYLLDRDGKPILDLETADYSLPDGWQWPEPIKMIAADGKTDIYGVMYRPSNFSSDKSYPLIDHSFIGHISSGVPTSSFRTGAEFSYAQGASLAELGFIVVQIDGRGGYYRNKTFRDHSYGWKDTGCDIDDHVDGIKQLAERYPQIDLNRVGIAGFVGGNGALLGLLHHQDFYKVGIAGEIFDFRVMRANAGDMYEGLGSRLNKEHLEELVHNLKGNLMILLGLLDYVPPAASLRIVEALNRANKDFDLIVEPCSGYGFTSYQLRRSWDFLVSHLQGSEPPANFQLDSLPTPIIPKDFAKHCRT